LQYNKRTIYGPIVKTKLQLDYDEQPNFRLEQRSDFCQAQTLLASSYVPGQMAQLSQMCPFDHFKLTGDDSATTTNELYFALLEPDDALRLHEALNAAWALLIATVLKRG
jgi:hypothetical protein